MDLLPSLYEQSVVTETALVKESDGPNDELSVAEIGVTQTRPGPLLLHSPTAIGRSWPVLAERSRRSRLRVQLPRAVKRRPKLKSPRSAGLALPAVVIAAAVLSRTAGGTAGTVYPAGAAGALLTASDLGDTWAEGGLSFDLGAV